MLLHPLTNRIFYMEHSYETDRPVLGLICGENNSFIVDAGNSPKHAQHFLSEVQKLSVPPVQYVAITHWHWDHVFGLQEMPYEVIGHEITKRKLDSMRLLSWDDDALDARVETGEEIAFCRDRIKKEMPDRRHLQIGAIQKTFQHKMTIDLGNQIVELIHVGGDHAEDSTIVYIPKEKVLFLGDCLSPDLYSGEWSYTMEKLQPLIQVIKRLDCRIYITGHHEPETAESFWSYFDCLVELGAFVGKRKSIEEVVNLFIKTYHHMPSDEQMACMQYFINGNKKRGLNRYEHLSSDNRR